MQYNVLAGVVELIEADSPEEAISTLNSRLTEAGFEPYPELRESFPENYQMAMLSENQKED